MMAIVVIIIGLILGLLGVRQLIYFFSEFSAFLARAEALVDGERFAEIERLNNEMDELNYSYYEILDDISERVVALENAKATESVSKKTPISEQRQAIVDLIERGLDDQTIAKQLGVGVSKVAIVRKLDSPHQ